MAVSALNLITTVVNFPLPRTSQDDNWHCADRLCSAEYNATGRLTVGILYNQIQALNLKKSESLRMQLLIGVKGQREKEGGGERGGSRERERERERKRERERERERETHARTTTTTTAAAATTTPTTTTATTNTLLSE